MCTIQAVAPGRLQVPWEYNLLYDFLSYSVNGQIMWKCFGRPGQVTLPMGEIPTCQFKMKTCKKMHSLLPLLSVNQWNINEPNPIHNITVSQIHFLESNFTLNFTNRSPKMINVYTWGYEHRCSYWIWAVLWSIYNQILKLNHLYSGPLSAVSLRSLSDAYPIGPYSIHSLCDNIIQNL